MSGEDPDQRFGRLERVPVRSQLGWSNEASDFTPWLADNLGLLSEQLGLGLEFEAQEHQVGRYSLDLLLRDEHGRLVCVENQFGQTDHDHLGKLLTYGAGTRAEVVVWIAETMTEEHIAALEWLNEKSVEGVGFFGVEVELLKIGDSRPAPHFTVVVRPNEWAKSVRPRTTELVEWDWEKYQSELHLPSDRLAVGKELTRLMQEAIGARGLSWSTKFRKGYVAFQRDGGYNVVIIDLAWSKPPRLAAKLPASPEELRIDDPFPELESFWRDTEKEWGWTVPSLANVPDVHKVIILADPYHPRSGPMRV